MFKAAKIGNVNIVVGKDHTGLYTAIASQNQVTRGQSTRRIDAQDLLAPFGLGEKEFIEVEAFIQAPMNLPTLHQEYHNSN